MIALLGTQPLVVNYHSGVLDGVAGRLGLTPPGTKELTHSPSEGMLRRFLNDLEHSIKVDDSGKPRGGASKEDSILSTPPTLCRGTEARSIAYFVITCFPTSSRTWMCSVWVNQHPHPVPGGGWTVNNSSNSSRK